MKSGDNPARWLFLILVAVVVVSMLASARSLASTGNYKDNVQDGAVLSVENTNRTSSGGYA